MSAIFGAFSDDGRLPGDAAIRKVLDTMRARGAERVEIRRVERAVLAVARHAWEGEPGFAGDVLLLEEDGIIVAADATIYYRDDLRRALARRGVEARGDSPSAWILAAYRAWGDECAARLEGDFAFLIWNTKTRRLCAARDYSGKRTLFHAQVGATTVLASTLSGVLATPGCPAELNLASIAETAAGLWAPAPESCYEAIRPVPAGWTLVRREQGRPELARHWSPPPVEPRDSTSFEDAAAQLRELLARAVDERLAPGAPTAVWLSGGWDSPAVFAAGQLTLTRSTGGRALRAVSISYPEGDPGREDELIQLIAEHWHAPVRWLDIRNIPIFDHPAERAARRDEPFAHPFEMWHRSLARGTRDVGARVALEGVGGDQLFQVSEVYFADLLRSLRFGELATDWRAKGMKGSGFRNFFRWAIQPLLPAPALELARLLRGGRPLVGYLERTLPPWIDRGFAARNGLEARERGYTAMRARGNCAAFETEWYLTHPYFPRLFGVTSAFALEEGVEIRSPLYDRRVIEFAVGRPRAERSSGAETKRLLRKAMDGLLPASILRTRASRTGVTGGYFDRSMREQFGALADQVFKAPLLADAGIIDAEVLRRSCSEYVRGGAGALGVSLYFTLQTELWLRARLRPVEELSSGPHERTVAVVG